MTPAHHVFVFGLLSDWLADYQNASNRDEAQACFERAIQIAREQTAKALERRETMTLARLLRDTNRRDETRTMLAEIYNWFTEGFDTADLKDAKSLLEELRASSMVCAKCNKDNPSDASFCEEFGARFRALASEISAEAGAQAVDVTWLVNIIREIR